MAVIVLAIALIFYLVRQNQKDEKKVTQHFNQQYKNSKGDGPELNDEK